MSPPPEGQVVLSPDDLRIVAKLEGKPLPRGGALAEVLELSPAAASRLVRGLRRRGALGSVSLVGLAPGVCECLTYIKIDWLQGGAPQLLDDWIAKDPAIVDGARVTGNFDYRLMSRHRSFRAANDWSQGLMSRPKVSDVLTHFCTTKFDRPNYAAAILGTDEMADSVPAATVSHCSNLISDIEKSM